MDLSWDAVLLGLFVVVPGFAYFGVTSVFAPPQKERVGEFEALARSIAVSGLLLAVEALIVVALSVFWGGLRGEIRSVVNVGLNNYFQKHTTESIATAAGISILNTGLLAGLAWFGFIPDLLRSEAARRGLTPFAVGHDVITRVHLETTGPLGVCVYLLNGGGMYHGAIAAWSAADETPDIALWQPRFRPKSGDAWEARGRAVIIPGNQIRCIELYTN